MQYVTIKDIARFAGVGVSTVSRVINNQPDVNAQTRQKVIEVIEKYNYMPNNNARNLKLSGAKNIGILVKGISNPFFFKMIEVIEKQIVQNGYSVVLQQVGFDEKETIKACELINEKKISGVIFLGGSYSNNLDDISPLSVPFVFSTITLFDCATDRFSSVCIDDVKESAKAVSYLYALGHRKIGILVSEVYNHSVAELRLTGYKQALLENGIPFDESLVIYAGSFSMKSGYEAMKKRMDSPVNFTALFAISDTLAVGASRALLDLGLKIPDDMSIIGFDGQDIGKYYNPQIATIKQPVTAMALKSIDQLFSLINGGSNQQNTFDAQLIKNASCAKLDLAGSRKPAAARSV